MINNTIQESCILITNKLVPKKSFGQLLDTSPKKLYIFKKFNSEFSYIKMWFTDQNSKPLEIEDKINITLVIN